MIAFQSGAFECTSLGELYKSTPKSGVSFGEHFGKYNLSDDLENYHEAAFDAFMTGVVLEHLLGDCPVQVHSWANHVMLDYWGSERTFKLVEDNFPSAKDQSRFERTIFAEFKQDARLEDAIYLFEVYGDFDI